MDVLFNEKENFIEIRDEIKLQNYFLKGMFILHMIVSMLQLSIMDKEDIKFIGIVWGVIGFVSLAMLLFLFFKRSTAGKIYIEDVKRVKEKTISGKKHFFIELQNGKHRKLYCKTNIEYENLSELFDEIGIKY